MNAHHGDEIVDIFGLTSAQKSAALERDRDVIVTAGAGSGKTRTLVARYVSLLADGYSPRSLAAVTFTNRAAREMRSRVRQALSDLERRASSDIERRRWMSLSAEMDSARIGTIHSLCMEILRAHPVEARIDPKFCIIDEGLLVVLRKQLVEDTMIFLIGQPAYSELFGVLETNAIYGLLAFLLDNRLETQEAFDKNIDGSQIIRQHILSLMKKSEFNDCIRELSSMNRDVLLEDAGDKLAQQVEELLSLWNEAEKALAADNLITCISYLFQLRREKMKGNIGRKESHVKELVCQLKCEYDGLLNPVIGGAASKDQPPDAVSEERFAQMSILIRQAFEVLSSNYQNTLRQRGALDFDDLEDGAARLLKLDDIRKYWQSEISTVLVDEFQDTNERQRYIVESLAGTAGKLFVVGDARQSIYRFRRADVTVFSSMLRRIKSQGGLIIDLDLTFRAHEPLLRASGDLLQTIMGTASDEARPYHVPFSALLAHRKTARASISAPHIEFVLGAGTDSYSARVQAARALAFYLHQLKDKGQLQSWDDVALLFRASTGFGFYENAFEEANIPFVTVAGRGFYDRPEIRDVMNILRALADITDDVAMAGLLRSPAFGLSDQALYLLRWQNDHHISYWTALQGDLSVLDDTDQCMAVRALKIIKDLLPHVDRIPVAILLKKLIDATDYRAILADEEYNGGGGRLWRNLDKLLVDAQESEQVNVRYFLDYIQSVNDAGVREGEAPSEAQGSVRLMTIHKSKGLEFPVVVLADASRDPGGAVSQAFLLPDLGLAFKMEKSPMLFRLAKQQDADQNYAETKRLLYVALTRASEKIIISGHLSQTAGGEWTAKAWLSELCHAAGVDVNYVMQQTETETNVKSMSGEAIRICKLSEDIESIEINKVSKIKVPLELNVKPIHEPLIDSVASNITTEETEDIHLLRATGMLDTAASSIIGSMVHKAIELWLFPDNPKLPDFLNAVARNAGLSLQSKREAAICRTNELLLRLKNHPLYAEIETAKNRYHELPYSRMVKGCTETGYIDLLYNSPEGWVIVDFKTDALQSHTQREEMVSVYTSQMYRYANAVNAILGQKPQTRICFLDDNGSVGLVKV